MTIRTTTLDNGLRVVTERMPDVRSVAAGFWVGTGSRDEPAEESGASHFLEHLLFKGTQDRGAREISEAVDAVGGDMDAFTAKEYTAFYVRVLEEDAALGLDLLSDILWRPALRPGDVEVERQVILEEILQHADEPADLVHEVWSSATFPDHPLGRETLGDEETVSALDRDRIHEFWAEQYRPANVVFAAAGRLDHDRMVDAVTVGVGAMEGGAAPRRAAPVRPSERVAVVEQDTEQAHLVVGVRALDRDHADRYTLAVLDHALGGGLSSRLWQSVREERGLAYSIYSFCNGYQGTGSLGVYAGTGPEHLGEVLDLVIAAFEDLAAGGITERELEVAQGHLVGEMALSLEDSGARMSRIARSLLVHGCVVPIVEYEASVRAVTLEDVRRVAAEVLSGPRSVAVVGPVTESAVAGAA